VYDKLVGLVTGRREVRSLRLFDDVSRKIVDIAMSDNWVMHCPHTNKHMRAADASVH
jgi:hypothetical protein